MAQRIGTWWFALAALAIFLGLTAGTATAAATRTWTGAGTTANWSEAANWDTAVPVAGDTLVFPPGASKKTNTNNLAAGTAFAIVKFTGGGYHLQGNAFDVTAELRNEGPSGETNIVENAVGGAGAVAQVSGRMALMGANSFGGQALVTGGALLVMNDSGLGSSADSTIVSDGAALQLAGSIDIGAEPVLITGAGPSGDGVLQSLSGINSADLVTVNAATTIGVAESVLILGAINQFAPGASLHLIGGGKLQVDGTGTFDGPVTAAEGNLTWNGATPGAAAVAPAGWLRGTGSVGSISASGGLVWPGSGTAPGILTSAGHATFSGGRFRADLDGPLVGTGYGQLLVAGPVSLGQNVTLLELELGYTPLVGQSFTIIKTTTAGAISGAFSGLPEGAEFSSGGLTFGISYKGPDGAGNDVVITVLRQVNADLSAALSVQPTTAAPGGLLSYTATVTNAGPDPATSPNMTMGIPGGTTFESVSAPPGWVCVEPSGPPPVSVRCTGTPLAAGASASMTVVVSVNAGASGPISATVGAFSQTNDANSGDNAATILTPVGAADPRPFKVRLPGVASD
jgi:uncharacterized repeat protein (TIGR01451 family)